MPPDQAAETPAGKPLAPETPLFEIPVAPVVECVTAVKEVLIHKIGVELAAEAVLAGVTVIVPVVVAGGQPPVVVTLYVNEPLAVGVPLMVNKFPDHEAVTPVGKPITFAPVAPVVANVIVEIGLLIHTVWLVPAAIVLLLIVIGREETGKHPVVEKGKAYFTIYEFTPTTDGVNCPVAKLKPVITGVTL